MTRVNSMFEPITLTRQVVATGDWTDTFAAAFGETKPPEYSGSVSYSCKHCSAVLKYELENCRNFVRTESGIAFDADVTGEPHECNQGDHQ